DTHPSHKAACTPHHPDTLHTLHQLNTNVRTFQHAIEQLSDRNAPLQQEQKPAMPSDPSEGSLALLLDPTTALVASLRGVSWVLAQPKKTDRSAATAVLACKAARRPPPATASSPFGPGVVTPRPSLGDEAPVRYAAALYAQVPGLDEKQVPDGERARRIYEQPSQPQASSTRTQLDPRRRRSGASGGLVRSRRSRPRTAESAAAQGMPGVLSSEEALLTSWGTRSARESQRP
ncbi:unnamed protein product, partial [Scytosiphon promiscuus]